MDRLFKQSVKDYVSKNNLHTLTFNQVKILHCIFHEEKINVTVLSERLMVKKSSISVAVEKLKEKGYIKKTISKSDKRSFDFLITEEGKNILAENKNLLSDSILPHFEKLSQNEIVTLGKILEKIL